MYARLLINDRRVGKRVEVQMKWPNFEFPFKEIFLVDVFTIPNSIKVEIGLIDGFSTTVVDIVNINVPGQHVKALTSASPLVQKIPFSRVAFEKSKIAKKFVAQSYKPDGKLSDAQQAKQKIAEDKKMKQETVK